MKRYDSPAAGSPSPRGRRPGTRWRRRACSS